MMRSGVICVLLVLLIRKGVGEDEFRPTPIPLNEWHEVRGWRGRAGTLQEALHAPTHYWEDALRHSVYLTLVRDKIDKLIAKGDYINHPTNDLDDRDLWDRVKQAPFESVNKEDPTMVGDVVMMAKGKLMEDKDGFRFVEADKFEEKCTDKCMDGVKALWSVKRIRQRDSDVTGRYHYELTFSVITQKKHKKHEKPARTFTVRETAPEKIVEEPLENRYYEPTPASVFAPVAVPIPVPVQPPRSERGLWVHKNIFTRNQARQHSNGLDRLFSSLFSDDDDDDLPPPRYKPKQYQYNQYNPPPPIYQQYSKAGYVGSPSEHQQKKLAPHKPHHLYKYNQYGRPIAPPPPPPPHHHHYLDIEQIGVVSAPYQDHRYGPHNKPGKTPRPAVLPTPPNPVLPQKNFSIETTTPLKPNPSEETTQKPDVHPAKTYNKHKPTTVKISYVTDHVRPPVYNAPPGVFVTMDKKPFKPMPPLRLVHSSKPHKNPRPTDFRPSPQVLDVSSFSEPDPLLDTAFRPITGNYANSNTTEKAVAASDNHLRKSNSTIKKPPKKNEIVKAQRVTTTAPEIITAHSVEEDSDAEWTNVLGAFAKTTPMAAETTEKEKVKTTETTTPMTTTTVATTTTTTPAPTTSTKRPLKRTTKTTTTEAPTTTPKPKKRTRPPPKFTKPEKIKKHKRITTTTTTTTEAPYKRKEQDLTPQASSSSATAQSTTTSSLSSTTTTTTTTTQSTTTPEQTTTTTQATTTTETPTPAPETEAPKQKSRYRQSTLKYRSVLTGHDKKEEKTRTVLPPTGVIPSRRKGSKYQNYITSTPKFSDMQFDEEGREDHVVSPYKSKSISTTESHKQATPKSTTPTYEEVADHVYITSESPEYSFSHEEDEFEDSYEKEDNQETRDTSEYLPSTSALATHADTANEIVEIEDDPFEITADTVSTTPISSPKNKTKCQKKKHQNVTNTTEEIKSENWKAEESNIHETISAERPAVIPTEIPENRPEVKSEEWSEEDKQEDKKTEDSELAVQALETSSTSTTTTTEASSTPDIFEEIFGGFKFDDSDTESKSNDTSKLDEQESTNNEQFIKAEDDFSDFFEAFDDKHRQHRDGKYEDEYEYDDKEHSLDDDEFQFQNEEDRRARDTKEEEETYDDYPERPYSLLELMAME